jgi:hypothetical protein
MEKGQVTALSFDPAHPASVRAIASDMDISLQDSTFCLFPVKCPMVLL